MLRLSKLHGTGNDFLVRVAESPEDVLDALVVAALCDRNRGIGADGVITIGAGNSHHDCSMLLQNADGGVAEMSGNGIRCLAYMAAKHGYARDDVLRVATGAGTRDVFLDRDEAGNVTRADVDMGTPKFGELLAFRLGEASFEGEVVDMGNPHLVFVLDELESVDVAVDGARIELDSQFPNRTNIEFTSVRDRRTAEMRVWERGVGETLSCGTGVCAAAAVLRRRDLIEDTISMHVPGGVLCVTIAETIRLAGPVVHIFDVDIDRSRLVASLS